MTYRIRFVLSLVLVLLGPAVSAQSSRMKVLLDTDIGNYLDDALALGLLLRLLLRPSTSFNPTQTLA